MTPQERDVLLPLLDKLRETRLPEKDAEADQLIRQAASQQPDAVYILAQTVLMQDYALHQAQEQIQQLQQSQSQSQSGQSSGGGFLGGLFGANRAMAPASQPQPNRPWGQPNQQGAYVQGAPAQAYAPQSTYGAPMMAAMQPGYGQPSFLRSAATTAAGIAGGALLFQGIEGLMGGHGMMGGGFGGGGMMGGGFGGMPQQDIVENTTVNNYYDQPAPDSDVAVQGGDNSGYVDPGTPDPGFQDDQPIDTSGSDDGSFGI
jgi:hypothetical protein